MILIDQIMPTHDRREVHRRAVDSALPGLWDAVRGVTEGELKAMKVLMGLRSLGRTSDGGDRPVLNSFRRMGFREVAEEPGRELVVVGIGRFWQPSGGLVKVEGREHFTGFHEPGYAKVAFNLRLDGAEISTETRIAGTDPGARRRFGLYWMLIRPGSGLIRHEWLRAIAKRAEASNPSA